MEEIHFLVNVLLVIPLHLNMEKCVAIASKKTRAKQRHIETFIDGLDFSSLLIKISSSKVQFVMVTV